MGTQEIMKHVIEPESVAVIGASGTPGKSGFSILANLLKTGYSGSVFPINPSVNEILGFKTYADIEDVPEKPDHVVIALPRNLVVGQLKKCVKKGIEVATIMGHGFADNGEVGQAIEREIVEVSRNSGIRVIGPNSWGVTNTKNGFSTITFPMGLPPAGGISVICQTGSFVHPAFAQQMGGMNKIIDIANASDISFSEVLEYLGSDDTTKVIVLHLEGIKDGESFVTTLKDVAGKKPVIILKVGRFPETAEAVSTHTGSLAGNYEIFEGLFRQTGAICVTDLDELFDLSRAFSCLPLMKGNGVGIISISGGMGAMAMDACEEFGMEVVELSDETVKGLHEISPPWEELRNPLDIWPASEFKGLDVAKVFTTAIDQVLSDVNVDGVVVFAPIIVPGQDYADAIREGASGYKEKPCAIFCIANEEGRKRFPELEKHGVVSFPTIKRCVRALSVLHRFYQNARL